MSAAETPIAYGTSYEVLTELDAVELIASEWNALLARSSCNLAFSSAQWFIANCRLNQNVAPRVLTARRDDALVGILPLVLAGTVAKFSDDESDYNDMVAARDDTAAMTGLLDHALAAAAGYQQLILPRLRADSNCIRATRILKPNGDLDKSFSRDTTCPYIRLLSSYEDYLSTRSKSFRTSLLQAHNYSARDNVRVTELEPESFSADSLPDIFLSLHLNRFAEGTTSLSSPNAQAFVREVFPSLFAERRLRAFALYEANSIIAINLCMVGADSLCLWNGGFTRAAERWSPGKLLISAGIRRAIALNLAEYDFLRGAETYKSRWTNAARDIGQLEFQIGH
jgi:CelD/BcsL family acetyltransferase involved in cellulose biosynthesis